MNNVNERSISFYTFDIYLLISGHPVDPEDVDYFGCFYVSLVRNRQSLTRTVSVWGHAFCCVWYANQKPCFDSENIVILKCQFDLSHFEDSYYKIEELIEKIA